LRRVATPEPLAVSVSATFHRKMPSFQAVNGFRTEFSGSETAVLPLVLQKSGLFFGKSDSVFTKPDSFFEKAGLIFGNSRAVSTLPGTILTGSGMIFQKPSQALAGTRKVS
jgi:hypothetical protein